MDIAILAGGYGTRLKGLWDKPKCLAFYQGRPVIEFIVNKALELKPRKVFLLLGHKASEVVAWREACCPHRDVVPIIETEYEGTAAAIRKAMPLMQCPLMILNGDTIPLYNLSDLVNAFNETTGRTVIAWNNNCYAGASLFGVYGMSRIDFTSSKDLNTYIYDSETQRLPVSGFLDIGTPEEFLKVQKS